MRRCRYRDGEKIASLQTIVELRDEPGQGKAADRKVRLTAAQMLLGEQAGGPTVNVNLGARTQIAPGVVIRLPPGVPATKLERAAPLIEQEGLEP